jgi:hypothetical protein
MQGNSGEACVFGYISFVFVATQSVYREEDTQGKGGGRRILLFSLLLSHWTVLIDVNDKHGSGSGPQLFYE